MFNLLPASTVFRYSKCSASQLVDDVVSENASSMKGLLTSKLSLASKITVLRARSHLETSTFVSSRYSMFRVYQACGRQGPANVQCLTLFRLLSMILILSSSARWRLFHTCCFLLCLLLNRRNPIIVSRPKIIMRLTCSCLLGSMLLR